jgi:hypothetical protein
MTTQGTGVAPSGHKIVGAGPKNWVCECGAKLQNLFYVRAHWATIEVRKND